jgi:spoIIIJ-associated protein
MPPASRLEAAPPTPAATPAKAEAGTDIETIAAQTVRDILGHMGLKPRVTVRQSPAEEGDDGPAYLIDVRGSDLGFLVGRRGEGLDSLQYLTRLIVQHKTGEWASVVIDIEGYRERRAQTLRDLAQQMAERVKRDGRAISLEPMPPYERRIVHLTLRDNPSVMTMSIGEGDTRKVTIRPKK